MTAVQKTMPEHWGERHAGSETMFWEPQHVISGLSWGQPRGPYIKCLVNPTRQVGLSPDSKGSSLSPESDSQHPLDLMTYTTHKNVAFCPGAV